MIRWYARAVRRLSQSATARPGGASPATPSRAVTLSCDTMTAGTPCARAHAPVQRSVVRSDTSSASGRSRASSPASRRLRHSTRYPPLNGTRGARTVITRPCAVCSSPSRSPGMTRTGSCPAAR